jgi:hypothetical protein
MKRSTPRIEADLPSREACDRYNQLAGKSKVIAGLHLTC